MVDFDEAARRQFGVVSRRQAIELRGERWFRRALRDRQLIVVGHGVYRCAGVAPSFRQRAFAACLMCGAPVALSHRSAAVLWGWEAVAVGPLIEVSVPRARSGRSADLRVYRVDLPTDETVERYGIPVTTPGRTLLDLAGTLPPAVLERSLDDVLRARQASPEELISWFRRDRRRGRTAAGRLGALVEARLASGVSDSVGVDRVHRWIVRAGLPLPLLGLPLEVAGHRRILDLAYPAEQIAIEFNGWEYHQMRSRMDADHARTTELELAGWLVIVVTAAHLESETVDRIARALALRNPAQRVPAQPLAAAGGSRGSPS